MKKLRLILVLITMFIILINNVSKAQTYARLNVDSINNSSQQNFCKTSYDGVKLFYLPGCGKDSISWSINISPYNILEKNDTVIILPNTYDGNVSIRDASGCHPCCGNTKQFGIHFNNPLTEPTFTDQTVCGTKTDTLDAGNAGNGATYKWSNSSTTQSIIIGEGTYTVTITNGCGVVSHSAIITKQTLPINLPNDTTICNGFPLVLKPGIFNNYLWSKDSANSDTLMITDAGTYRVTVTDNGLNCVDTASTVVIITPPPFYSQSTDLCLNGFTTLTPGVFDNYVWSNNHFTSSINIDDDSTYTVTVSNNSDHCNSIYEYQINKLFPPIQQICFTEFDTITTKNSINWTNNLSGNVDSVKIYQEIALNVWSLIGTVSRSANHFVDLTSNPQNQSYSYKISVIDTCGNEGDKSDYHTTITLLSAYDAGTQTYGFTWSAYGGIIVSTYKLYGIESGGTITLIGSVPGNQFFYNYVTPDPKYIKYFVGFETPECDAKSNYLVKSNLVQATASTVGIKSISIQNLSIYPNPNNGMFNISFYKNGVNNVDIDVVNNIGQTVYSETYTENKYNKTIDLSNFSKGIYSINIRVDDKIFENKIIIQ